MTSLPSNISRVPNLLTSQMLVAGLNRTNVGLLNIQERMSSGMDVMRPSDDVVRASAISVLLDRMQRSQQRQANLGAADNTLGLLDTSLGNAADFVTEAKSIASAQIGANSDATTRSSQAVVVDSLISQMVSLMNRETSGVYVFGGSTPGSPPLQALAGGYRYTAHGSGLITDLDVGDQVPTTLGGDSTLGQISARVQSTADLNPALTGATAISSLRGARGLGVQLGTVSFSFNGGPSATVDLTGSDTAQDIATRLTSAIHQYETDNSVTVLGPGGVSFSGGALSIDVVGGVPNPALTFSDSGSGLTGQDLGLTTTPFSATSSTGVDLNPRLTMLSPVSTLAGVTTPLGSIRIRFNQGGNSSVRDVDLSSAQTVDDVRRLIEGTNTGVRVEINNAGTGINVLNEVSGPAMTIEEVPGGADTATELGIRSLTGATQLSDFNDGRGVRIVDGAVNPQTGLPDPALNTDFTVHLGNGNSFPVDLRPQDMTTVQSVINRINSEAAAAATRGDIPAGSFSAGLTSGANGIAFSDLQHLGPITVTRENNSGAAEDLGLMNGSYDAPSATFVAQDRAGARVNNVLTALMDLRDALRNNDSAGITLAGDALDQHTDRITSARALVGAYSQRVQRATEREQDVSNLDEQTRSGLQDLDYTSASIRFSLLRTQLQAGLTVGAQTQSKTLLDFLQ